MDKSYKIQRERWSNEQIELLKNNWTIPIPKEKLMSLINRPMKSIYQKALKLGLPLPGNGLTEDELKEIKDKIILVLDILEKTRNQKLAFKEAHISAGTFTKHIVNYKELEEKYWKIVEWMRNTFICTKCKGIFENKQACSNLELSIRAVNRCKNCNRKHKSNISNTLRGRLKQCLHKGKGRVGGDLTIDQLFEIYNNQQGKCYYTGLEMLYKTDKPGDFNLLSIDRKDSDGLYTKDNVVLACWGVNKLKVDLPINKFVKFTDMVSEHMRNKEILDKIKNIPFIY